MKNIYAIRYASLNYAELDLELIDIIMQRPDDLPIEDVTEFGIRNTSFKSWWRTPVTKFISAEGYDNAEIPDIGTWIDATLVFSPKAYEFLGDHLEESGEFLPILVDGVEYKIFNCSVTGEVDEEKSEFEYFGEERVDVKHLVFKESAAEHLVFKTPEESCLTLYCNEMFKELVEYHKLTGVKFDTELIPGFEF